MHCEFEIRRTTQQETLELVEKSGIIPVQSYRVTLDGMPDNPLFKSLGCLSCPRLKLEGEVRLLRILPPERALTHPELMHPHVGSRSLDGKSFTLSCELIDNWKTHPDLRRMEPPCLTKKQIEVDFTKDN